MTVQESVNELENEIQNSWNECLLELNDIEEPDLDNIKNDILSECVDIDCQGGELGSSGLKEFEERTETALEQFLCDVKNNNYIFKKNISQSISDLVSDYEYEEDK
jgi:hypothetical protein